MNLSPKTLAPPNTRNMKRRSRLPCRANQIFVATKANRATISKIDNKTLGIIQLYQKTACLAIVWFQEAGLQDGTILELLGGLVQKTR